MHPRCFAGVQSASAVWHCAIPARLSSAPAMSATARAQVHRQWHGLFRSDINTLTDGPNRINGCFRNSFNGQPALHGLLRAPAFPLAPPGSAGPRRRTSVLNSRARSSHLRRHGPHQARRDGRLAWDAGLRVPGHVEMVPEKPRTHFGGGGRRRTVRRWRWAFRRRASADLRSRLPIPAKGFTGPCLNHRLGAHARAPDAFGPETT